MGQAVDQAERERELTKQQLEDNLNRFETRVRAELDWKARLRRDGVRYVVVGAGAAATLVALVLLRSKLRHNDDDTDAAAIQVASLADIAAELQSLRAEVERGRKGKDSQPLWQKAALRAVTTAGAAAGTLVARGLMERFGQGGDESEPSDRF